MVETHFVEDGQINVCCKMVERFCGPCFPKTVVCSTDKTKHHLVYQVSTIIALLCLLEALDSSVISKNSLFTTLKDLIKK